MNEDLHDIDKLFKEGLDGHLEEAPPSVWEEVNHDLDKKQAAHFRDKYYRLKRLALLFLLIAFVGGAGVVYYALSKKENATSSTKIKPSVTTTVAKKVQPLPEVGLNKNVTSGEEPAITDSANRNEWFLNDNDSNEKAVVKSGDVDNELTVNNENGKASINSATDKNLPAVDESKNIITKQEDKNLVGGNHRSNNKSIINKNTDVVANNEAGKGFHRNNSNRFTTKQVFTDSPATNNHSNITAPIKKVTGIVNNVAQQKTEPWPQDVSPDRKMEAIAHNSYPPIDVKLLSTERNNVSSATNKPQAKSKASSSHGFYLTAFFAPNISFDHLKDDDHLAGPGRNRNEVRRDEGSSSSFSGGLLLSYSLTNKVAWQTGVIISSTSTGIAPKKLYARPDNNGRPGYELHCSSGYSYITPKNGTQPAVGDSVSITGSTSKLSYVSVPVSVGITVQKGRFSLHPSIGIGANFLISGKTETTLPASENAVAGITGLRPVYMDGRIGVGAEYALGKKLLLSLKPTARLALTPINQQTPVKSYQNYLSIEAGIKIKL